MGACLSVPGVMTPLGRLSTKVLGWYSAFWGVWHLTLKKQNLLQKSLWFLHILYPVFHINKPLGWRSSKIRCQTCVERWPACFSKPEYFCIVYFKIVFLNMIMVGFGRVQLVGTEHWTGTVWQQPPATRLLVCVCIWFLFLFAFVFPLFICICICLVQLVRTRDGSVKRNHLTIVTATVE